MYLVEKIGNLILVTFEGDVTNIEIDTIKNEFNFKHADTVFIGEENFRSFSDNETMGVEWYKRHRMYTKDL